MSRRLASLLLAVVAATGLLAVPAGAADVRAAAPDLTIVTNARYDVQPDQHRIRVTVDMVLANHLRDTKTRRFYFDRTFLSILPRTSAFKLTSAGAVKPRVSVSKKTSDYTLLQLDLGRRLYSGKSATYRLVFDLVDSGGEPNRDVRIGTSLVSFPVWAFATDSTPGSTVRVVFPAGYQVEVKSGNIAAPTTGTDGTVQLETGKLTNPLSFFAFLVADRPASYLERTETATVGGSPIALTVRAWSDDTAWSERVGGLVARALPVLSERIGLDWPREGGLIVHESITRSTGGYSGLFDPTAGQIEVAYDAGDFVVLHESAHAWFNGALLSDRWANEAFASYYALEVASALDVEASGDALTPALEAARIPLNGWGAIGREQPATEDYAYAATLTLARAIAERAGENGLRAVWADAAGRIGAYQPPPAPGGSTPAVGGGAGEPETVEGAADWRGLLDLLEANSAVSFDDLWRTWVARDSDLALLDDRKDARSRYDAAVAAAGDWQMPRAVRDAMRAWRFDQARVLLAGAGTILEQRGTIVAAAAAAGLTAPNTLRTAFESPDGFASATLEASAELAAIHAYEAAVAARLTTPDVLQSAGLWGTTPEVDVDRARALFAEGDLAASAAAAGAAGTAWASAQDVGRGRVVSLGLLALALVLAVMLAAMWWRGRRRQARTAALADAGAGPISELHPDDADVRPVAAAPDSYATLAASLDPTERVVVGDDGPRGAEPD